MKKVLVLAFGVLFFVYGKALAATEYDGHWYELFNMQSSGGILWADAKKDSENKGGHLVTITSAGENNFIKNNLAVPSGYSALIGLYQDPTSRNFSEPDGGWKWVTDEPITYTNWRSGEPNDRGQNDSVGAMNGSPALGYWSDWIKSGKETSYIVEWNKKPELIQKIYIDWENPINANIKSETDSQTGKNSLVAEKGEEYLDTEKYFNKEFAESYKKEVVDKVKKIFQDSGINGIPIIDSSGQTSAPQGALVVKFGPYIESVNHGTDGWAYDIAVVGRGIDRFNHRLDGEVAVFLDLNNLESSEYVAETIAHEVGHGLGLRHVNPFLYNDIEVMDYDHAENSPEKFSNIVTNLVEPPFRPALEYEEDGKKKYISAGGRDINILDATHNSLYHLRRYTLGESHESLIAQGINQGSWDNQGIADMFLDFIGIYSNKGLNDLTVVSMGSNSTGDESTAIFYSSSFNPDDFLNGQLKLYLDDPIRIMAASKSGQALDIYFGTGDEQNPNLIFDSSETGLHKGKIFQYFPETKSFSIIGNFDYEVVVTPEPSSVFLFLLGLGIVILFQQKRRIYKLCNM